MRNARNGGVVVSQRGYADAEMAVAGRDWTRTRARPGQYTSGPEESSAPTALADAFLRAARVKEIDPEEVPRMPDPKAYSTFLGVRWADTEGNPVCPVCEGIEVYRYEARKIFKCKQCGKQFSATSKTLFASRKLPFQGVLHCLTTVAGDAKISATNLGREIGVNARTAQSLAKRLGLEDGRRGNAGSFGRLSYPYMRTAPLTDDHALIAAISRAVPPQWSADMREDICQEVALGMFCGDYDRADIPGALEDARLKYSRMFRGKYGPLSLDTPVFDDGKGARWIDNIRSDREHW